MGSATRTAMLSLAAGLVLAVGAARAQTTFHIQMISPVQTTWIERVGDLARSGVAGTQAVVQAVDTWVRRGYQRRPAVIVGAAGLLALPLLALAGWFLYRRRPEPAAMEREADIPTASAAAIIEIDGAGQVELPSSRDLLQIGRHDDNDVCLSDDSVHRYHAVIERSARAGFIITDLSGPDGAGVRVNGERLATTQLLDGDTVEVGNARLRFKIAA